MSICELNKNKAAELALPVGLKPTHAWQCYTLMQHPGLIVIRNPFMALGQRYWMSRCLRDYPQKPNISNLDANPAMADFSTDWWMELQRSTDKQAKQRIKTSMRWTTLGYHHNWDTKVYDEAMHNKFPDDLKALCQFFSLAIGFANYEPQAAIVNYYPIGTTLSGHTDHSELNLKAPLFSFSFGQAAIFLIGGTTVDEKPSALFLRSGDVLVMSEQSRLCYHAVPRILPTDLKPWNDCLPPTKDDDKAVGHCMDTVLYSNVYDDQFWLPFEDYITDSRINVNVRQVLEFGKTEFK
ncbi:AlkB [Drosophila busckii]|uniref:AlkB n=2 Tax=Drosophila busckii TaxID=30019 RepID=A0A0M4FAC9_DROBS|nr:AlkB [Drosophila busckii]